MLCIPVEPLELFHGRSLLGRGGDCPEKAAWEPKTNRKTETVFVQVEASGHSSILLPAISGCAHAHICGTILWTTGAVQHLARSRTGAASKRTYGLLWWQISCMQRHSCLVHDVASRSCAQSL